MDLQLADYLWSYVHCIDRFTKVWETKQFYLEKNLALPKEEMVPHQSSDNPGEPISLEDVPIPRHWFYVLVER